MLAVSDLDHEAFLRWAREAGLAELSALLLWRWDADGQAESFPNRGRGRVDGAGCLGDVGASVL
jgi:hypothetical protein